MKKNTAVFLSLLLFLVILGFVVFCGTFNSESPNHSTELTNILNSESIQISPQTSIDPHTSDTPEDISNSLIENATSDDVETTNNHVTDKADTTAITTSEETTATSEITSNPQEETTVSPAETTDIPVETTVVPEETTTLQQFTVSSSGYTGVYDGVPHSITIICEEANIISYSLSPDGLYATTNPTFTDAGTYTVYYKVEKEGYETIIGSEIIAIEKAQGALTLSETSGELTYPNGGSFLITENTSEGALSVGSLDVNVASANIMGNTVTILPGITAGTTTITVISASTENYTGAEATYTVTVNNGELKALATAYEGIYDGQPHSIDVNCSDAKITYCDRADGIYTATLPTYTDAGSYTVYYKVEKEGYRTVTSSETITINKASGVVTLSSNKGSLTYPLSGTFSVKENVSSGKLNVISSDTQVVSVNIKDGEIKITPISVGAATITVVSESTNNFTEAFATYSVTVEPGDLKITAIPYRGTYDKKSHSITVSCRDATITYSTSESGSYLSKLPAFTDAGTYTVYYKVTKENYKTATGSAKVTINKAPGKIALSEYEGLTYAKESGDTFNLDRTIVITENLSGGALSIKKIGFADVIVELNGVSFTVSPGYSEEVATIRITSAETNNYESASVDYILTINKLTDFSRVDYDGQPHGINVYCPDDMITYSTTEGGEYTSEKPTYINAGRYWTYYKVTTAEYGVITRKEFVDIYKADGFMSLSSSNVSLDKGETYTFYITENTSGGQLNVSSSNPTVANATVSGNAVTVTVNNEGGAVILTITSGETENYNSATSKFTVHTGGKTAYAVYSEDDNSLRFYSSADIIRVGDVYNGLTVTAVYTGFDTVHYDSRKDVPWATYRKAIKYVSVEDEDIVPVSIAHWFSGFLNCTEANLSLLDTKNVVSAKSTFSSFGGYILGLEKWNVSNVIDMSHMFERTSALAENFEIDLSSWDVSNVRNMESMFEGTASNATVWSIGDISNWDVSRVENMESMFESAGAHATYKLDLSKWRPINVKYWLDREYFARHVEDCIIEPTWQ